MCSSHEEQPVVDILNEKIGSYIIKLSSCKLNAQDVYFGYQHYWWPSLKFGAPVPNFSLDYNHLALLHRALLPKLRVVSTFPVVMQFSPPIFGGLGLHSIEFESLAQSVNVFVSLYTANTPIKKLLQVAIEFLQLEAGFLGDVLSRDFSQYEGLVTDTWVVSLWSSLSKFNLCLHLPCSQQASAVKNP